ncbi:MAG: CDP-glycerol glycerophosphotransferase family protein [Opitutales bacterium]|nr:CDP-glycerol glycerophosphotransferase family protein [Opitutales bacterium]
MIEKFLKLEENWVLFYDMFSKNHCGDSTAPIAEKLRAARPDLKFFFVKKRGEKIEIPLADEIADEDSWKLRYVLAKAKFVVSPMGYPFRGVKRSGQVFVQTWHGTPLKKLYLSRDKTLPHNKRYARRFRNTDVFCVSCEFAKEAFKEALELNDSQFIKSGLPRNDLLCPARDNQKLIEKIKSELGLPASKKIILYCPTWRKYGNRAGATLPFDLEKMKKELGGEYAVLIRSHVGKQAWVDAKGKPANIFDGEFSFDGGSWGEATQLYLIADIMVSDYSSAVFDFAITQKPQIMYAYDLEEYKKEFGLYLDYERDFAAFPVAKTEGELISAVKNIGNFGGQYGEKYRAFKEKFCAYEKGDATGQVVNYILSKQ